MTKDEYKKQYEKFSIEYLKELKDRGNELDPEAHKAIDEIFMEEGVSLEELGKINDPPIIKNVDKGIKESLTKFLNAIVIVVLLSAVFTFNAIFAQNLKDGYGAWWTLTVIGICIGWFIWKLFKWIRKKLS